MKAYVWLQGNDVSIWTSMGVTTYGAYANRHINIHTVLILMVKIRDLRLYLRVSCIGHLFIKKRMERNGFERNSGRYTYIFVRC